MESVDATLVELLWNDLDGQVSRVQIASSIAEVATRFESA
jgi:hypothetical protein